MNTQRVKQLTAAAAQQGIDCVAIVPGANMVYCTGLSFHLSERPTLALFPSNGQPALILPALEAGKVESGPGQAFNWRLFPWKDEEGAGHAFAQACQALGLAGRALAVEELTMRVLEINLLQTNAPGLKLSAAEALLAPLRMRKSEDELAKMRRAAEISQTALSDVLNTLQAGMSEREVVAELKVACLRRGADELSFDPLVLTGPNSALPHGIPGDSRLQAGQLLLMDFGVIFEGYVSDITRTFALGEVGDELRRIYDLVLQANTAGRAATRPAVPIQDVDRAARAVINAGGYQDYFTHRLGHGLGLSVHEAPYACEGDETRLEAGMTFTIEPGIYLPGRGGVRIEDDVVVRPGGCDSLTDFERTLCVLPL